MATRVPLPKFHNHTTERFHRRMEDPSFFDPFVQPEERKFNALDWFLIGIACLLLAVAAAMRAFWSWS